jgi:hypothetical protein
MNIGSPESDERYEVVLKHYSAGVLHRASFKTLNRAQAFLMARWNELPVDSGRTHIECGAAIFDKYGSRKRLSTLGAAYLVNEDRAKNRR